MLPFLIKNTDWTYRFIEFSGIRDVTRASNICEYSRLFIQACVILSVLVSLVFSLSFCLTFYIGMQLLIMTLKPIPKEVFVGAWLYLYQIGFVIFYSGLGISLAFLGAMLMIEYENKRRYSTNKKKESAFALMVRSWKNKFCVPIKIVSDEKI